MTYVPFTVKMTEDQITDKLKSLYGTEFTAADIKAFVAMNDITYQTVTKKLQKYKVSKGKWNLCLLYTSPSPRDRTRSRMPSSA